MATLKSWFYLCTNCQEITATPPGDDYRPGPCGRCGCERLDACSKCEKPLQGYYREVALERWCHECDSARTNPTLRVDETRWEVRAQTPPTGIFVHALSPDDEMVSADIRLLDRGSLLTWLRSRGGKNEWAEAVVMCLLGHAPPEEKP